MKSAREVADGAQWAGPDEATWIFKAIEARDAEHVAVLHEAQERLAGKLLTVLEERDRLKVELAEARRAIVEREQKWDAMEQGRHSVMAWARRDECRYLLSKIGPAVPESSAPYDPTVPRGVPCPPAQSPAESPCSAGTCNSPKACAQAGKCIDARIRETADDSTGVKRDVETALRHLDRIEDHERRLKALEAVDAARAVAAAAPQEQAGHAGIPHCSNDEPCCGCEAGSGCLQDLWERAFAAGKSSGGRA